MLLNAGANILATNGKKNATAFFMAVQKGHMNLVNFFLQHANKTGKLKSLINIPNARGTSPLAIAIQIGNLDAATLLINEGANVNASNVNGMTPMMEAAQYGDIDILELLAQKGADPKYKNKSGETAASILKDEYGEDLHEILLVHHPRFQNVTTDSHGHTHLHKVHKGPNGVRKGPSNKGPGGKSRIMKRPSMVLKQSALHKKGNEEALKLFNQFDVDKSRTIDLDELTACLESLGFKERFGKKFEAVVRKALEAVDSTKDGKIDEDEFVKLHHTMIVKYKETKRSERQNRAVEVQKASNVKKRGSMVMFKRAAKKVKRMVHLKHAFGSSNNKKQNNQESQVHSYLSNTMCS